MKKLMIAFAAVAMAACANAATVKWNTGALYNPNANGTWSETIAAQGSGTWLAKVTFYSDNDGVQGDVFAPGGTLTASTINNMTHALNNTAGTGTGGFEKSTYYWAVLDLKYNGGMGDQTLTTEAYRFTTSGQSSTTLNFQTVGALSSDDKYTALSVPEPTSAMLLLLGFAGLALRRKQK